MPRGEIAIVVHRQLLRKSRCVGEEDIRNSLTLDDGIISQRFSQLPERR